MLPGLDMGLDAYYKLAKDMIDDGQFGQAVVLTQFNWASGYSEGAEFKFGNTGEKGYRYRIVGVVKEIHEVGIDEVPRPAVYGLHEQGSDQMSMPPIGIAVRTAVEPASIVT